LELGLGLLLRLFVTFALGTVTLDWAFEATILGFFTDLLTVFAAALLILLVSNDSN
jgi:hypothetical protein